MTTSINVLDANGVTQNVNTLPALGQSTAANSLPVVLANNAVLPNTSITSGNVAISGNVAGITANLSIGSLPTLPTGNNIIGRVGFSQDNYETVAASQTAQAMGATGALGDYLAGVLIVPTTTSPGNVLINDGSLANVTIFAGGTSSVLSLHPFFVPLGIKSANGAWKVSTGANVTAIGVGSFT